MKSSAARTDESASPRLTLRYFSEEVVRKFLNLESGWLRTFRELLLRPGEMLRRYVAGDRSGYANPLSFLLINALIVLVFMSFLGFNERILAMSMSMLDAPTLGQYRLQKFVTGYLFQNMNLMYIGILVPFAVVMRLLFRKSGYNLAEFLVITIFMMAESMLFSVILLPIPLLFEISSLAYSVLGLSLGIGYFSYASIGFLGGRVITVLKTAFSYLFGYFFFLFVFLLLLLVYVLTFGNAEASRMYSDEWTMVSAAEENALPVVRRLLEEGQNPDVTLGYTALHIALNNGYDEIASTLIEHGADLNSKDYLGRTPLFIAMMRDNWSMASKMVEAGADVTERTDIGTTYLMLAIGKGNDDFATRLLERGVDVNAVRTENTQTTALGLAAAEGNLNMVRELLSHGADPYLKDGNGTTPMDLAASEAVREAMQKTGRVASPDHDSSEQESHDVDGE